MFWLLEEELKGYYKHGNLPHYDNDEVTQFITYRLHDTVPKNLLHKWKDDISMCSKFAKGSDEYIELERKIHKYEDSGYGACYLKIPQIKEIIKENLEYFNGKRYELIEYIIMPNHVHLLLKPYKGYSLDKTMHSLKSYTANKCNEILNRSGSFWMEDYFDRYIRSEKHFNYTIQYIRDNWKKKE